MKSSSGLWRSKTDVGVKTSTTFNAPGVYVAPYGKTVVRIGGRGGTGNSPTGGNYAGEDYAGTNDPAYGGVNPPDYGGIGPPTGHTTWYQTFPGGDYYSDNPYLYGQNPSSGYYAPNDNYWTNSYSVYYTPGEPYYNPGNPYYNPGTDYYTPYYNPYVPGNAYPPANIGGVTFPGGSASSLAPVVGMTSTAISYAPAGLSISVPPGGYITVDNI